MKSLAFMVALFLAGCSPEQPVTEEEDIFVMACKRLLEYNLRSPSSLQIVSVIFNEGTPSQPEDTGETFDRIPRPDDPGYYFRVGSVWIIYDASNAYGTLVRGKINCEMGARYTDFDFRSANLGGREIEKDLLRTYRGLIAANLLLEEVGEITNRNK